ncbi:LLM class flavin-dependent oxidoreductase [Luteimicrobium subarcticum]|uniref:FAD/FMN-containing dehydrogenase n=1 Tax=Luteimicrobium subarcticum TaxID=620910 RepID=A0A2M8WSK5_9MICO|nr:LLM class flavin-dependent oxidoreductase [Luteimicrobium subarcticum]PJI93888.1 FAD/FMN-containing dehydrogenase [Luteimicrobium subarcticum]
MTDYGHDLTFGSFLTPRADAAEQVVDLAVASEEAGLDLVTFQDHPYQPSFLDTWTLLSYVAARTERVHLAPNVANLPLRQPAVLARSAASLDLLSGGRVELALGSGAFWDAIVAMGGQRLTPGQAVDALSEAIDVVRGIWDAGERRALRVDGTYHQVAGAKRGPLPAHDIGLWLGAYKPRMLRLTGAKADGWLPSMGYLQPGDLDRGNAVIDEAADDAGRDPREIRRILNVSGAFTGTTPPPGTPVDAGSIQGPVDWWVEALATLATEHGVATFVLGSDDPRTLATFGREVAPAVREEVAARRASAGTTTGVVRPARALALREPGIDYDAVPSSLRDRAVEPGDREYPLVRSTYMRGGRPGIVLRPRTTGEVVDALQFTRAQQDAGNGADDRLPLSVRSGGHGISGRSTNDGGVVVDLKRLDEVTVLDRATRRVRVGAGATWGRVAAVLGEHGWGVSSGDSGGVGVGGLATAGGVGLMGRLHGLTIDSVVAYDVVLADGTVARASADENPDLFWGLRGAGGSLGVVTHVELAAHDVPPVVFATLLWDASDPAALLRAWGEVVESSPRELTSFLIVQAARRGNPAVAQAYSVFASDDVPAAERALTPLLGIAPLLQQQAQVVPYSAVVAAHDVPHQGEGDGGTYRNSVVDTFDVDTARRAAAVVESGLGQLFQVRAVGGAVNDLTSDATAYAHRDGQQFVVSNVAFARRTEFDAVWDEQMLPVQHGSYVSFSTDRRPERLVDVFPGPTLARLRDVKRRYDPENVFDRNADLT